MKQLMLRLGGAANAVARSGKRLLALCYAVFFAASILMCLYGFAEDRVQRALGNVRQTEVPAADFSLIELTENQDGTYTSQSPDPRMVLEDTPAYVRSVTVRAEFLNMDPGEFCLFYKSRPDMEEFDVNSRVWAHLNEDGSYTFTLPRGPVYGLRLDPGIYTGLTFSLDSVVLNEPRSLAMWFAPTRPWLLAQVAVPALAAAAIQVLAGAVHGLGCWRTAGKTSVVSGKNHKKEVI